MITKRTRVAAKVGQEDVALGAGNDENVSVGGVVAEGVEGDAGDVGVVADDVAHRPGADRRQLRVAEPQLAVYVGVREKVPGERRMSLSGRSIWIRTRYGNANALSVD